MTRFDDIRHYTDDEMLQALKRIERFQELKPVAAYAFPDLSYEQFIELLDSITNTPDLQHRVMVKGMENVIAKTMTSFTFSGLENIQPDKSYLYISNHRDIVLDAYLLQCILDTHGMSTTRITFGANLMKNEFLRELGLCNKMFRTERGGTAKGFYAALAHLSDYINNSILNDNESVWIAQRGGRTKDGFDVTDPALIKMLGMASPYSDLVAAYGSLNIVPLSISYEWEPCDSLKAIERCKTVDGKYVKAENEDLISVVTGITQPKGAVHLSIGKPITIEDLVELPSVRNDFCDALAAMLDTKINAGYHISPNNYIACDIMNGNDCHSEKYTSEQFAAFKSRMDSVLNETPQVDVEKLRRYFLEIYACAVRN
ncbi:MAG: 1-acyl-sn-glycerol-3-phosphate acyltransferase [Bacteroidales bacterium]|nr:1-acyl-sn-glycerol-3-phosphate acyltransferase [Bacteroidales bacterium]